MSVVESRTPFRLEHPSGSAESGDLATFEHLYACLRRVCARRMMHERLGHTLQATALAHEVLLRLFGAGAEGSGSPRLRGRISARWFLAQSAAAIRHIVVDHARGKLRKKRGGGWARIDIEPSLIPSQRQADGEAIVVADKLLTELAAVSARQAQIAQLRFFGGLTFLQIAAVLEVDEHIVRREWRLAQVWLGSRPAATAWDAG